MALAAIGIVFLFTARFQVGQVVFRDAQACKLVTHGIYSKIRNPIYVFSFMMVVGVLLVVQKPALFVLARSYFLVVHYSSAQGGAGLKLSLAMNTGISAEHLV